MAKKHSKSKLPSQVKSKKAGTKKVLGKAGKLPARKASAKTKTVSLGRPKVTAEEKLFLLFKEDYHARQIFEFLRAETVRDLETWSPEEIVRLLSKPIRQSVERIRLKLAQHNRCLKGDELFALEHSGDERSNS